MAASNTLDAPQVPDSAGRFGAFGGRYVPETLTRALDELTLDEVTAHAKVPKGSAYFFYADIEDLYASLLTQIQQELITVLQRPLRGARFAPRV